MPGSDPSPEAMARAAGLGATWASHRAEVEEAIATARRLRDSLARQPRPAPAEEPMPAYAIPPGPEGPAR